MPTETQIIRALKKVLDPELQISVYDMGLIYDIGIAKNGEVRIVMTLTSAGCPLVSMIQSDIVEAVGRVKGVKAVHIDVTFDPVWTVDRMSDAAKKQLGI